MSVTWPHDLHLALRLFRTTPLVSAAAILSLALGIGANTAIFSIANSLLLRALPVYRADRLVLLAASPPASMPPVWGNAAWEQIRDRRRDLFQTAFAFSNRTTRFNLASDGPVDPIEGLWVSGDYFAGLAVTPILGRAITAADDRRGGGPDGPVAVISHAFWQGRLGGDPKVIGRSLTLDHVPFTIIGVMPQGFFGAEVGGSFAVAAPLATEPLVRGRDAFLDRATWLVVMARLKDGQTPQEAQQALRNVQPQIRAATMPADAPADVKARYLTTPIWVQRASFGTSLLRARYRDPLLAMLIVVALVLLIACANIANLVLARAAARRHEFSVRMALGASQYRLWRQLFAESALLAAAGASLGLLVATWGSALLVRQLSTPINPVFLDVPVDGRVLAFTTAIATIAAFLFGIGPARRAARADPADAIRERGRGASRARRATFADLLVVGQVALSVLIVVTAGLLVRTFISLTALDLGFDRDPILIAQVDVRRTTAAAAERPALYDRLAEAVGSIAGVSGAAVSDITPVSGSVTDAIVEVENGPSLTMPQNIAYRNAITAGWFTTYGTQLIAGRDFDSRDGRTGSLVAIVNETFVRRFLGDGDPIGRRFRQGVPGRQGPWLEVIGVVRDAVYRSLRAPSPPTFYVDLAQAKEPGAIASVSVRSTSGRPELLTRSVADAIAAVDSRIAITFTPLKAQVDAALVQERLLAKLSGFFGSLALLLAGVGLYGVTWQIVSQRRGEIGIRLALGAAPAAVVRLVLVRVATLAGAGVALGIGMSMWTSTFIAPLLYGVAPRDVRTTIWSTLVLLVVVIVAAGLPTLRAARIDPARVLRES